jgi:hypothetical protein
VANYRQAAAYDKPQYKVEGDKVYETDAYGRGPPAEVRNQEQRFTFEVSRGGTGGQVIDEPVGSQAVSCAAKP